MQIKSRGNEKLFHIVVARYILCYIWPCSTVITGLHEIIATLYFAKINRVADVTMRLSEVPDDRHSSKYCTGSVESSDSKYARD